MAKHHLIKSIEITAFVIFTLMIVYFAASGSLSMIGMDHAWPYPIK